MKPGHWLMTIYLLWATPTFGAGISMLNDARQLMSQHPEKVLLVLVSQPDCGFCVQVTEDILKPMLISGDYDHNTLIRRVEINNGRELNDFQGNVISAEQFANRYRAVGTPTLLFLDATGQSVVQNMVGYNTPELYGYYVGRSLSKARQQIAGPEQIMKRP